MRKLIVIVFAIFCSALLFEIQSQKNITKGLRVIKVPKVKVDVPKIPRVNPRFLIGGGIVGNSHLPSVKPIVPRIALRPIVAKPTYLFLNGLTKLQRDSITQENNKSYQFLSHGVETRKAYRHIIDSINHLTSRYDSIYHEVDSISADEFAKILSADSVFASYIEDRAMGYPEQMLIWSKLLCEVYPHVTQKVMRFKSIDFDEVTEMRREYFLTDTLTFKQIYKNILVRMVNLNGTPSFR